MRGSILIDVQKSCRNKVQYYHKNFAVAAVKEMGIVHRKKFYKYKCTNCGFYHITSSPQSGRYQRVKLIDRMN